MTDFNGWYLCRTLMAMGFLIPIAIRDAKEKKIRNKMLFVWGGLDIFLLLAESVVTQQTILQIFANYFLAGIIFTAVLFMIAVFMKNGLGMGDVKLFGVIGLTFGMLDSFRILFYSLLAAAFYSIFLLMRKKADKKSKLPFGPFVLTGCLFHILLAMVS